MNEISSEKIEKNFNQTFSYPSYPDDSTLSSDLNMSYSSISMRKTTCSKNFNDYDISQLRLNYFCKLMSKGIWNPKRKIPKNNTIIIFDWDDTLLCTSFLSNYNFDIEEVLKKNNNYELLYKLEKKIFEILSLSIQKGETYIITNAEKGWVEYTSQIFFPSILKLLNHIKIISARDENQNKFPNDIRMWKINSFNNAFRQFDHDGIINIISIGDSFFEIEASKLLNSKFCNSFIKTVQFVQSIKIEELIDQIELIAYKFDFIVNSPKNYTIKLGKNNVPKSKIEGKKLN